MTVGNSLYLTANYAFNYSKSELAHLEVFDRIVQFFEKEIGLEGFKEYHIEEGSDVDILFDNLYDGFFNKDIDSVVRRYLVEFELYEILADYKEPVCEEGLELKRNLIEAVKELKDV